MKIFVAGATGATGRLLVKQLLDSGVKVKAVVRTPDKLTDEVGTPPHLELIKASVTEVADDELERMVKDCDGVAVCLGHTVNLKGMYGPPRRLVSGTVERLCKAIRENGRDHPVRFVLMNTSGNRYPDLGESLPFSQRLLLGFLRFALPPHVDNEKAADYLRENIGDTDHAIEWVAVRPDTLVDEPTVTRYEIHPSPLTNTIFGSLSTSRINVANFMADLFTDQDTWDKWKGKLPLIYNEVSLRQHTKKRTTVESE